MNTHIYAFHSFVTEKTRQFGYFPSIELTRKQVNTLMQIHLYFWVKKCLSSRWQNIKF